VRRRDFGRHRKLSSLSYWAIRDRHLTGTIMTETPLVAGNWKMHSGSPAELTKMMQGATELASLVSLMVCPPSTLLAEFARLARNSPVAIGGQDCHAEPSGAFTGDLSAEMLRDAGAVAVIVGHSERRAYHHETDAEVNAKARAAWRAGLAAIVCIGETKDERVAGKTLDVVGSQAAASLPEGATPANLVVAYEPVWAIGTGLTPTPADVAEVHGFIRQHLQTRYGAAGARMRILYGGSVKPSNAAELMRVSNVNGALVGGASLSAQDFLGIARAYR
jgi:triosephosphate isomerase